MSVNESVSMKLSTIVPMLLFINKSTSITQSATEKLSMSETSLLMEFVVLLDVVAKNLFTFETREIQ